MPKDYLRTPIGWYGGKGNMVEKLLPLFPAHKIYVEPYGGGASMLMAKSPSEIEVYNDLDERLIEFFRVIREPRLFKQFYRKVQLTPYSRTQWEMCREEWDSYKDPVDRAWAWYVVARMSFSGQWGGSWKHVVTLSRRGMAGAVSSWLSIIEQLPDIHTRLLRVQIENKDAIELIQAYDDIECLFYLDPPYSVETRSDARYRIDMTMEDHEKLVQVLLKSNSMILLSGYEHEVYKPLEDAGWHVTKWETACSATGRTKATGVLGEGTALDTQARTEVLWRNPAAVRNLQPTLF